MVFKNQIIFGFSFVFPLQENFEQMSLRFEFMTKDALTSVEIL